MSLTFLTSSIDSALIGNHGKKVGIVGIPPLQIIQQLNHKGMDLYDLDTPLVGIDMEKTTPYIPRVYCAILRTVVLNALHLDLDAVYIDVGPGKCDSALHVAAVLENILTVPVFSTKNEDQKAFGNPICRSKMRLEEKFIRITEGIKSADFHREYEFCNPTAGFWGVPPRDFSILNLFPDTTHIYGWTRCMENKTPSDTKLESYYNPSIPTVFFAQSFCAKTALAHLLAKKHPRSLFLDSDVTAGSSAKAKIQAFLELAGVFG